MLAVKNGKIITDEGILEGKSIIIKDDKIIGIEGSTPSGIDVINAGGNFVSPGFIDIHIHGAGGTDVMDGSREAIETISKTIASHGVTSFVPTTITAPTDKIKKALKVVRESIDTGVSGANVLGVHLEGPFINLKAKGAHDERFILKPDIDAFMDIVGDDYSLVRLMTIAPEIDGAMDLIKFIVGHGITVSIGHSTGTYDEIMMAVGSGAHHSTHLYNAMSGFAHREPGVVGAVFDSRITTEFIADGTHVHFAAIRTALAAKGYNNCALVSDAMRACCLGDGEYSLGGQEVKVKNGEARLYNGTLAGSTLTLNAAVRNIMKNTSLNIIEAVSMATSVPARICRINNTKGHLKQGYDADIIIFDSDINIKEVIIGGKIIE